MYVQTDHAIHSSEKIFLSSMAILDINIKKKMVDENNNNKNKNVRLIDISRGECRDRSYNTYVLVCWVILLYDLCKDYLLLQMAEVDLFQIK